MRFLPHIQILFHFFLLVDTVVEDHSPHGMGGKSNYYQIVTTKISTYVL